MSDPHEVDDKGRPTVEAESAESAESAAPPGPAAEALVRRQIERTLRGMALSTLVGLVAIVVVAALLPSIRGVLILVGIVYLLGSLAARWYLRRRFLSRLEGRESRG